jgi:hypothetical protein
LAAELDMELRIFSVFFPGSIATDPGRRGQFLLNR